MTKNKPAVVAFFNRLAGRKPATRLSQLRPLKKLMTADCGDVQHLRSPAPLSRGCPPVVAAELGSKLPDPWETSRLPCYVKPKKYL